MKKKMNWKVKHCLLKKKKRCNGEKNGRKENNLTFAIEKTKKTSSVVFLKRKCKSEGFVFEFCDGPKSQQIKSTPSPQHLR